ncbi:FxsA family protein [Halochromatium glycolicum]|uniref:Exlusion protein FxsA n=1 Tax=Halochromatium glycolicum TaxID=85075 RepID=A0AAJ0XAM6_9GAMM|nr:FxsA family protein [Halochromatium glycolicum]MBK1705921.1 exlusion protein FxsA [Halochromatium glycolicum]
MWIFLLIFVFAPLIELYFLIQVGSVIGALPTILLSILTAVIGGYLVRMQGLAVLMRVRSMLERGETPALELLDGAVLLLCGFALLLPGFITDAIGFALLVPPLRRALVRRYVQVMPAQGEVIVRRETSSRRTIEGDWRRDD